jgi:nitrate reductase gamma subunit
MNIKDDASTARNDIQEMSGLLGDALSQFAKLFQNEVDLAKAELSEKIRTASIAAGLLIGGAILVIPALTMALLALSAALMAAGWSPAMSQLIAAIVAAVIAGLLIAIGMRRLQTRKLLPQETIRQFEKDKDAVKEMVR